MWGDGGGTQAPCRGYLGPVLTRPPILSNLQRSVSDNTLVAMDFSGHAGRVIENPREALSAALEEAQAWRVCTGDLLSTWVSMEREEESEGRGEAPSCRRSLCILQGLVIPQPRPDPPCPPLLCRRRRTTVSACPPRARARASVQVGEGPPSPGVGTAMASLRIPHGGGG